jgi:hypothetical protein
VRRGGQPRRPAAHRPLRQGEGDEDLDGAAPIVVEGTSVVIDHPARDGFVAVLELQLRDARRVR